MSLCFDLGAVLEGHADVLLAVYGDVMLLFKAWFPPEFKGFVKPGISAKSIGLIIKDSVFIDPASKSGMFLCKTEKRT